MESENKKEWTESDWLSYHNKQRAFDALNDALARGDKQEITRSLQTPTIIITQSLPRKRK